MSNAEISDQRAKLFASIQRDPEVFSEVYRLLKAGSSAGTQLESLGAFGDDRLAASSTLADLFENAPRPADSVQLDSFTLGGADGVQLDVLVDDPLSNLGDPVRLEAIVESIGRPALPIVGIDWQPTPIATLQERLRVARQHIVRCIPAVGRIDGEARMKGTGWLLYDDILITNGHVAKTFVSQSVDKLNFTFDEEVQFDNRDEPVATTVHQAKIVDVSMYWPDNLDMAALKIQWRERPDFAPLELDFSPHQLELDVAAIGYPADDGRESSFSKLLYFQKIFEIKRLSPGRLLNIDDPVFFQHDCTTLGGSSGSPIVNLENGKVVGLHYSGCPGTANRAVKSGPLQQVLSKFAS